MAATPADDQACSRCRKMDDRISQHAIGLKRSQILYLRKFAADRYEGNINMAVRYLVDRAMESTDFQPPAND